MVIFVTLMMLACGATAAKPKDKATPNYGFVSSCMQNVTQRCSEECAAQNPNQTLYQECLKRDEISMAYNHSVINFHVCIGEMNPCLRLNMTINYGEDCWGKCSGAGYQKCLSKCKETSQEAPEAQLYLQCAIQMNPAHALFWKCLQELDPNIAIEAMKKAKEVYDKIQQENPASLLNSQPQE